MDGDAFRAFLRDERARSDRLGEPFVVLAFDVGNDPSRCRRVIEVVAKRIRATDILGWLEEGRLGAALIGTSVRAGLGIAAMIQESFAEEVGKVACTAYGYPPFRYGVGQEGSRDKQEAGDVGAFAGEESDMGSKQEQS